MPRQNTPTPRPKASALQKARERLLELVHGAVTIDEYVFNRCRALQNRPAHLAIADLTHDLAVKLLTVAQALAYMHSELSLYHMDIKPGNILVDTSEKPYITDLGFARCRTSYRDDEEVPVGFTYGYAHPFLTNMGKFRAPSTLAKARNRIRARELTPRFDLYSLGRTILALIRLLEIRYGGRVRANYGANYLHLLAALLLDGQNVETMPTPEMRQDFASEVACGVKEDLLRVFHLGACRSLESERVTPSAL